MNSPVASVAKSLLDFKSALAGWDERIMKSFQDALDWVCLEGYKMGYTDGYKAAGSQQEIA